MRQIFRAFNTFCLWLERHAVGILTTIILHLLIVLGVMILKMSTAKNLEYTIEIDYSALEETPTIEPSESELSAAEQFQKLEQTVALKNQVSNTAAEQKAIESIAQMEQAIKDELNIKDIAPDPIDAPQKTDKPAQNEQKQSSATITPNAGKTLVSYDLANRNHVLLRTPSYLCQGGGTVVIDIWVKQNGYIEKVALNKSLSQTTDPCLIETALKYSKTARFNSNPAAPNPQQGTITYIFQAQ